MEEILKNFDNIFKTNQSTHFNKKDFPILLAIFDKFRENLDVDTKMNMKLKKDKFVMQQKLQDSFTDAQQKMFEDYWELENQLKSFSEEEIFLFGYFLRKELEIENDNELI